MEAVIDFLLKVRSEMNRQLIVFFFNFTGGSQGDVML